MYVLKVNEEPTNSLIIQCIGTQYSPTCFGTLNCHHQGVKHDPDEIGAQCRGKHRRMGAVYCDRRRDHVIPLRTSSCLTPNRVFPSQDGISLYTAVT
jgi:hypothetical protein